MDLAIGTSADSVVKGGNDYADKATSVNDPLKEVLQQMADSFAALSAQTNEDLASANASMSWTMLISALLGLGVGIGVAAYMGRGISASTSAVLSKAEAIAAHRKLRRMAIVQSGGHGRGGNGGQHIALGHGRREKIEKLSLRET